MPQSAFVGAEWPRQHLGEIMTTVRTTQPAMAELNLRNDNEIANAIAPEKRTADLEPTAI